MYPDENQEEAVTRTVEEIMSEQVTLMENSEGTTGEGKKPLFETEEILAIFRELAPKVEDENFTLHLVREGYIAPELVQFYPGEARALARQVRAKMFALAKEKQRIAATSKEAEGTEPVNIAKRRSSKHGKH